jgi:hypothetical protein
VYAPGWEGSCGTLHGAAVRGPPWGCRAGPSMGLQHDVEAAPARGGPGRGWTLWRRPAVVYWIGPSNPGTRPRPLEAASHLPNHLRGVTRAGGQDERGRLLGKATEGLGGEGRQRRPSVSATQH